MNTVQYRKEAISGLAGNPLIEALPERRSPEEVISAMMERMPYSGDERQGAEKDRVGSLQNILRIYQPSEKDIELYYQIERALYWGYADRNPINNGFAAMINEEFQACKDNEVSVQYSSFRPVSSGFALIGISGLGKSSSVRKCLSLFPQLIRHQKYGTIPFNETQIVWIHIDCPSDGSLKGLCGSFFEAIDTLLDTDYTSQYDDKRTTLNRIRIAMNRIVRTYHVGMLVIDEIQSLCVAKDNSIPVKTLNFLVELVNRIGIPVLLIGTPRALNFLQKEFQQAKRASGQGDALWEPMKNDEDWDMFVDAIWQYQYTKKDVPNSLDFKNALYNESAGVPFLAVHIYMLTQEKAILSGQESFSPADFHKTASNRMRLTEAMKEALISGKDINLNQFLDLAPFKEKDFITAMPAPCQTDPPVGQSAPKPSKEDLQTKAINALLAFGVPVNDAKKHVNITLARMPECTDSTVIAKESYHAYADRSSDGSAKGDAGDTSEMLPEGYDANMEGGNIGI